MTDVNLKEVAASGMIWNALQKYAVLGVMFISSIILARLLTPYDYGCIGMLEIFISIATIMIDGGFGSALLQKKRPTQEDYSTFFYWNLLVSTVLYIILYIFAPVIADFYSIELLSSVLRILGLVLFINALKMIQSNLLRKNFRFKPMAITVIVSSLISVVVTIIMAFLGCGVWSLVVQHLLIALLPMLVFWVITGWKPLFCFSTKSFKELFNFGGFMFLTGIVNTLSDNIQGLLIGRVYNPSTMGYYAKAKTTEALASTGISQVIDSFALQLYAEVQDDLPRLKVTLKKLTATLAYVTSPLIISLMLVALPLFVILYSDRWVSSVFYFRILAFAGLAICLQAVNLQAIAAIGKSKVMFSWALTKRIINIGLILCGLLIGGMKGLLIGMAIGAWIAYYINAKLVSKYIGYKMKQQMLDLLPIVIVSLCAAVPAYIISQILPWRMMGPFVAMVLFIGLYLGLSSLFKLESFIYCKELIPYFVNKIFKSNQRNG